MDHNKGGYPQPGGYPPQQGGYPQQGPYPPPYSPTNAGYNQQPYGVSQTPNVVVVGDGHHHHQTIVVERQGVNHVLHFCISLFFWPWVIVWIILCITDESH
ncbi:hypothetical protein LOTGIDRAFT_231285 [Lottia gigantea]|uniref:Uncharacterized protein n=1 Tax=Lottia gigantea TaxID=225164 RepID=V4CAW6_LOTGI|nr:hypothetical protein LOTGIDRAFT_231285 [Lottia gigantea]ESO98969.1 hypothetical protein LOTGIDRAFT_231285 [Lottia gigantea]